MSLFVQSVTRSLSSGRPKEHGDGNPRGSHAVQPSILLLLAPLPRAPPAVPAKALRPPIFDTSIMPRISAEALFNACFTGDAATQPGRAALPAPRQQVRAAHHSGDRGRAHRNCANDTRARAKDRRGPRGWGRRHGAARGGAKPPRRYPPRHEFADTTAAARDQRARVAKAAG